MLTLPDVFPVAVLNTKLITISRCTWCSGGGVLPLTHIHIFTHCQRHKYIHSYILLLSYKYTRTQLYAYIQISVYICGLICIKHIHTNTCILSQTDAYNRAVQTRKYKGVPHDFYQTKGDVEISLERKIVPFSKMYMGSDYFFLVELFLGLHPLTYEKK